MFGLNYPEITPEGVALHSLVECAEHLERVKPGNLYIVSAACSAHRALQAALTCALAGSANIGASPPSLRAKWLQFFEKDRAERQKRTPDFRVMALRELLTEAVTTALPWSGSPMPLSAVESFSLLRLASYRDSFEHPKQLTFILTNREVASCASYGAEVAIRALQEAAHQIFEILPAAQATAQRIRIAAAKVESEELARLPA